MGTNTSCSFYTQTKDDKKKTKSESEEKRETTKKYKKMGNMVQVENMK